MGSRIKPKESILMNNLSRGQTFNNQPDETILIIDFALKFNKAQSRLKNRDIYSFTGGGTIFISKNRIRHKVGYDCCIVSLKN